MRDANAYTAIASKGGAPQHPGWFHNLTAEPEVEIQVACSFAAARRPSPDAPMLFVILSWLAFFLLLTGSGALAVAGLARATRALDLAGLDLFQTFWIGCAVVIACAQLTNLIAISPNFQPSGIDSLPRSPPGTASASRPSSVVGSATTSTSMSLGRSIVGSGSLDCCTS